MASQWTQEDNYGYDFRRHHGFRNPPVIPPSPYPGAWYSKRQLACPGQHEPHGRFMFRRPPGAWRSPTASELAADGKVDSFFRPNPNPGKKGSNVLSHPEQHGGYWDGYWAMLGCWQSLPRTAPPADDGDVNDERQLESLYGDTRTNGPTTHSSDLPNRNVSSTLESAGGAVAGRAAGHDLFEWEVAGEAVDATSETLNNYAAAHEADNARQDGDEEGGEDFEELGLVMSPEWAEHFQKSPSLQRYLQRIRSKNGLQGRGTKGGRGRRRGNTSSKNDRPKLATAASDRTKNPAASEGETSHSTTTEEMAKEKEAEAKEAERKALELELAKIKAQAILYASQPRQPLEDIAEED